MATATTPPDSSAPRGLFGANRDDGRVRLPGSLHTNRRIAQWLAFDEPGVVKVHTGKAELGQGILTALQSVVAEELDVPVAAVRVLSASTARGPDEGMTSGSLSVQDSGGALRQACAEVRAIAVRAAAELSGVPFEGIGVRDGRLHSDRADNLGDYWSLLEGVNLDIECSGVARPKAPDARRLFGRARPARVDLADKVFGHARFIHDLRLPDMLHGRVLRGPTLGAKLVNWPPPALGALREGVRCWADGNFVAVVAPRERDADAVADRLRKRLQWKVAEPLPDANDLSAWLSTAPHETTVPAQRGEAPWPVGTRPCAKAHRGPPLRGRVLQAVPRARVDRPVVRACEPGRRAARGLVPQPGRLRAAGRDRRRPRPGARARHRPPRPGRGLLRPQRRRRRSVRRGAARLAAAAAGPRAVDARGRVQQRAVRAGHGREDRSLDRCARPHRRLAVRQLGRRPPFASRPPTVPRLLAAWQRDRRRHRDDARTTCR